VIAQVADFSGAPTYGTAPLTVQFTDASTNNPTSWLWDFGDGDSTNATMQNPLHTYASVGTYTVSLTATNATGSDSEEKNGYITVCAAGSVRLADSAWPKFGSDLNNTGQSLYTGPHTGNVLWSYTAGNIDYAGQSIGADGTIYVGSLDNNLYALNADGTLKWSYATGNSICSSPAIAADGTVYIGSYESKL